MAKLVHSHHISESGKGSAHVDSYGRPFGGDDHVAAVEDKEFPSDTGLLVVEHSHEGVSSEPHPLTKIDQWTFKSEEERQAEDNEEIHEDDLGRRTVFARATPLDSTAGEDAARAAARTTLAVDPPSRVRKRVVVPESDEEPTEEEPTS